MIKCAANRLPHILLPFPLLSAVAFACRVDVRALPRAPDSERLKRLEGDAGLRSFVEVNELARRSAETNEAVGKLLQTLRQELRLALRAMRTSLSRTSQRSWEEAVRVALPSGSAHSSPRFPTLAAIGLSAQEAYARDHRLAFSRARAVPTLHRLQLNADGELVRGAPILPPVAQPVAARTSLHRAWRLSDAVHTRSTGTARTDHGRLQKRHGPAMPRGVVVQVSRQSLPSVYY